MDCPQRKIKLFYTLEEWQVLEGTAKGMHGCDLRAFLYRQVEKLSRMAPGEYTNITPDKIPLDFIIPADKSCALMELSKRFNIPMATLVARFVVIPILKDHYESNGLPKSIVV